MLYRRWEATVSPHTTAKINAFSPKAQALSVPEFLLSFPAVSLFEPIGTISNNLSEFDSSNPTSNKVLDIEVTKTSGNIRVADASPLNSSRKNCSIPLLTPCLKMSPPKSFILLEPASDFSIKKGQRIHQYTPFPVGIQNLSDALDSESSSCQTSEDLSSKYPELFGINVTHDLRNRMNIMEDSPNWLVSPSKTCTIMEPSDDESLETLIANCFPKETASIHNEVDNLSTMKESDCEGNLGFATKTYQYKDSFIPSNISNFTPIIDQSASTFRIGRHPGENTLKRELWKKFEATCDLGNPLNERILQDSFQKGFLDRLEEASSE